MNTRNLFSASVLVLLLVVGCDARMQSEGPDTESHQTVDQVAISIDSEQRIVLDGETVHLEDLQGTLIRKLGDDKADFEITVAPKTPMGLVSDVQQQLPTKNVASIRYHDAQG